MRQIKGLFWITGASSGIGRAVALELAQRGWRVVASARRTGLLAALAAEHPNIIALPLDVTDRAAVSAAVARIEGDHGPITGAFLNAGGWNKSQRGTVDAQAFAATYDLNVMGVVNALDPLLPLFEARGAGQVAIVASVAGYRGLPNAYAYTSSKAALINLAESLRIDLGPRGIKVQLVNPGFVKSELTAQNDHPMPFLLETAEAARRIADGLAGTGFEIAFPRRTVWPMKLLGLLPAALYLPLVRRFSPRAALQDLLQDRV